MGSPNFYTGSKHPSFGITPYLFLLKNGHAAPYEASDYDHEEANDAISEMLDMIKAEIDDINNDLHFYHLRTEIGYHDGFQILLDEECSAEDVIDNVYIDVGHNETTLDLGDAYTLDYGGFRLPLAEWDYPENLVTPKIERDEEGCIVDVTLIPNKKAFSEWHENEMHYACHKMAKIAKDYGLHLLVGQTWTSSLLEDEQENEAAINQLYMPELFETKTALMAQTPSMGG